MILKTTSLAICRLEKLILARHPYDTPEFLVLRYGGTKRYLDWLGDCSYSHAVNAKCLRLKFQMLNRNAYQRRFAA